MQDLGIFHAYIDDAPEHTFQQLRRYYIIAGVFEYYITRLAPNMTALAEAPKHVIVNNPYGQC
jgi:hypothetical protein